MTASLAQYGGIVLAALLALACGSPQPPPHLVLIVIDTLRADHLGLYGYARPTSANVDALARRGVVFERAMATSSWTKPSMGSLFTGRRPSHHGAVSFTRHLDPDLPTLAERLRDAGYRTLGVTGNFVHVNETTGLHRGFETFEAVSRRIRPGEGDALLDMETENGRTVELRAPSAGEINDVVLERLPPAAGLPLFLYVHYMEPHAGYAPPPEALQRVAPGAEPGGVTSDAVVSAAAADRRLTLPERQRWIDYYDGEIAAVDAAIGGLLDALEARGFGDDTVVVLVSDHGEEFADHGGWFHGINLHEESLRIPLVLSDLRSAGAGVRRDDPVDLRDVPVTLLALAGARPLPQAEGRNLLADASLGPHDQLAELHGDPPFERHVQRRDQRLALTRWPWKLILRRRGDPTLYRLDRDPEERNPMDPRTPDAPPGLLETAEMLARDSAALDAPSPGDDLDVRTLEGLRALGYAE